MTDPDDILAEAWAREAGRPTCQQHLWQRLAEEAGKDRPMHADRHFSCLRCKTKRTDRWNGESWELYIGVEPPARPKAEEIPATMREKGERAAANGWPRTRSTDPEWLAGYDAVASQRRIMPKPDPTSIDLADTMSPEEQRDHVLAARERSRRLSGV